MYSVKDDDSCKESFRRVRRIAEKMEESPSMAV